MRKFKFTGLIFFILGLINTGCDNNVRSGNPDIWLGDYAYDETPVKANAGYSMVMNWKLSINKKGDVYQGALAVNGQQTNMELLTDVKGDANAVAITYNSLVYGTDENFRVGDTLFLLTGKGDNIKTIWGELEPRLMEHPDKECYCFRHVRKLNNY